VSADPTPLAFDDHGSGVPIVLIHGLTFDRRSWRPVIELLGGGVRAIAVDMPGHGDSRGLPRSLEDVAARVHDVVVDCSADRPVVVGHSIGGRIALVYASRYPVRGVVIVDSSTDLASLALEMRELEPALRGDSFSEAFAALEATMDIDLIPEPLRSEIQQRRSVRKDVVLSYWNELFRTEPVRLQAQFARTVADIPAPCLAVFGRRLSAGERTQVQALLPSAEIDEWPGRGHCLHLVEPARFTPLVAVLAAP
jgi:pimeloyl-ACP methyl ester carboxylesterase